ncbi:hypothetical protein PVAP13_7KG261800 [Panicum virgatum]|uniref:Ubiquitin-like protease family profile domain-containing protein n=1 Tax=Panicum virgatum TaxID=38727 RepID=A0A8T0QIZ4_PANVG|nr:hypothetical protein PVAP13_7KG261800 [Panicum virgatum]
MATRRRRELPDYGMSNIGEEVDDAPIDECSSDSDGAGLSEPDGDPAQSEGSSSSDDQALQRKLYKEVLIDYERLKELKRKLKLSVTLENNKSKPDHKPKDAFTRFSVTAFSSVLDSLNPRQREVIESYGFGSLLNFDKCFVPNKFAKWVANVVDYKYGDIVVDGKIISLTKESVHCVLGIPLGGDPFPSDTVCGKEFVLNKFQKSSIPPVTFFSNKLVKEGGTLSDEDLFVCFIIVALSSFLCANSSSTPSPKYFGIFGDIKRVKEFDWCGYVLDWLLDGVKLFKKSKPSRVKDNRTLAGCLYYLALFFPIFFNEHWFVFVVDIKDRKFVFLDSLYQKDHEFHEIVRDRLITSFQVHWDNYVQVDMGFGKYELLYPNVPHQPLENSFDSGIYTMMFLEHWKSPRTVMRNIFDSSDINIIRVKFANDLLFLPGNSRNKNRVIEYSN